MRTIIFLLLISSVNLFSQSLSKADSYMASGLNDAAIKMYSKIIKENDHRKFQAYYGRSYAYYNLKDFKNAKSDIKKALKIPKSNSSYNWVMGNGYWMYSLIETPEVTSELSLGLLKKAHEYIETSLLMSTIGFNEATLGKSKDAIESCTKAMELDPSNAYAWSNRALAYLALNDLDAARKDIDYSIELDNQNMYAYKHSALIYFAENELTLACLELDKAKVLDYTGRMVREGAGEIIKLINQNCQLTIEDDQSEPQTETNGTEEIATEPLLTQSPNDNEKFIRVYPNPTKDIINLDLSRVSDKIQITLVNINGQTQKTLVANSNQAQIDVSDMANGVYFIQFETSNYWIREKVVVQK